MSHNASAHALRQLLPAMEKWLLFNLGDRADDWGGSIFMAYETIEEKVGMSRSTLKRTFRKLIKKKKVELELEATPVSPPFYRMLGVPAPVQVKRQDETCPHVLRRAAILIFSQRCEFCGRQGMKEWGPDGKPWQILQLEPDKYAGRPTPDNVTLACQTCERKKHRSLEGVRSLVVRQRERPRQSPDPSMFDGREGEGRGQVDPTSTERGGFNLTSPGGQVDAGEGPTWPGGGAKLNPDPCTDPSMDSSTDSDQIPSNGCTERNPEQRRANERAASRDVATEGSGWMRWKDRAAFDADVATMPIPGMFASAPMARRFGYRVLEAHPGEIFDAHVAMLQAALEAKGIATSEEQCRLAMADVYVERSPRDRKWDRAADRDRRRGRR